jgi:3-oxoacyl-(acyl-carrier-protein) synthase
MAHVFRNRAEPPPIGTQKAMIGHALAAAGPLDAAWAAMMLHAGTHVDGCAPPSPIADPRLRFARGGARLEGDAILCFGSGWQGLNAAVVLRRHGG